MTDIVTKPVLTQYAISVWTMWSVLGEKIEKHSEYILVKSESYLLKPVRLLRRK